MAFRCPECGVTSHNPNDEREGYCGRCHDYTGMGAQTHAERGDRMMGDLVTVIVEHIHEVLPDLQIPPWQEMPRNVQIMVLMILGQPLVDAARVIRVAAEMESRT